MRALLITLVTLLLANSVYCSDADQKPLNEEFLRNYMAGEYDIIGGARLIRVQLTRDV